MAKVLASLEGKERVILSLIFLIIFGLLIFDIWEDLASGASFEHVAIETAIISLSIAGILIQWSVFFMQRKNIETLHHNLGEARIDLANYKKETKMFVQGLGQQIDEQLTQWKLSAAEKEIALLILKGLSNKEIAEIRNTSDKTVRQQVTSILNKSNLTSRLELSAFFLEDLLLPKTIS